MSGAGWRCASCCSSKPDLLLLDEPTNHLDAESVQWLEQHLASYPGAVLAVTHDRYFLDNVAEWILELDRGRAYPYEGNYSTYLEKKAERLEVQGKKDQKLQKRLKEELAWVRSGAKARQAKTKARLQRYEEMAAEAEKTRKLDFEEIQIPAGPRLGNLVVEVEHLDKGFDGRMLIKDLSFTLPRNGIVGVIGPNGVGKTTLFKTIVGLEEPDSGNVKVGETVKLSYVDQNRGGIDPKKNVWQVVSDGLDYIKVGQIEMPSRAYVSAFGFKGPDQQKPAGVLSGGERNRLNLALTLKEGGNLILLDEPTNDLDVETLGSLENALEQFPGCAVVISPRPLVPGPHLHPHPGVGGRRRRRGQVVLVRGQLLRLRGEQDRPAGRRRGPSAPGDPPQAHPRLSVAAARPGAAKRRHPTTVGAQLSQEPIAMTVNPGTVAPSTGRSSRRTLTEKLQHAYLGTFRGPHGDAPHTDVDSADTGALKSRRGADTALTALLAAHYRLAQHRPVGETRVAVHAADAPGGFGPALQIVTDDSEMLMDSVTVLAAPPRRGLRVDHEPRFTVHRDPRGSCCDIAASRRRR